MNSKGDRHLGKCGSSVVPRQLQDRSRNKLLQIIHSNMDDLSYLFGLFPSRPKKHDKISVQMYVYNWVKLDTMMAHIMANLILSVQNCK